MRIDGLTWSWLLDAGSEYLVRGIEMKHIGNTRNLNDQIRKREKIFFFFKYLFFKFKSMIDWIREVIDDHTLPSGTAAIFLLRDEVLQYANLRKETLIHFNTF